MEQWSHARNGTHNNNRDKNRKLFFSIGRLVTSFGSHIQRQARNSMHYQCFPTLRNIQHWKIGLPGRRPKIFTVLFNQRMIMLIFNLWQIRKEDQRSWASGEKTAACQAFRHLFIAWFNLILSLHSTNSKTSSKTCHNTRKFKQFDDKRKANANVERLRYSGRQARNNNKYLSFNSEFLIEIIVSRNNCRLHLKWMLSCIKIIYFWISSSPCLTETKQFWNIWIKTEAHSACFISSLWMDYVISFCRKPLGRT